MAKKVFFSFHYIPDNWRASQVRNAGVIEGNQAVSDNDWETVTKKGDPAIEKWIADQMAGRSCAVVLVGSGTANRKWINHEIIKAWGKGMGVVGVNIHALKDASGAQAAKGSNPFDYLDFGAVKFSSIVKLYNPPYSDSKQAYDHIKTNIASWVEEACSIRAKY